MKGEPAAQRVIEIVLLARAEQEIISRLTVQFLVAGMPVSPGIAKSIASINGVLASAPNNNGPFCVDNQEAKATACRGLTIPKFTPGGA
jgi:hypothetical protein